jgi:SAM-dependent methyltransferase
MQRKDHWEKVYESKATQSVSWYQPHASMSLSLIAKAELSAAQSIIDVGGGASTLIDDLISLGYKHVTILDISRAALDATRHRLGSAAETVHWIEGDITQVTLGENAYDLWHDRAVFHFLTAAEERTAYVAQVTRSLRPGGHLVIATFGPQGPTQCSGLPVIRYAPQELYAQFGDGFRLLEHADEVHVTPGGATQQFVYCLLVKL